MADPKGGFQSKTKPVWCQTTPVGTWGQPNKVNGSLLMLAEGCREPPWVMARGLGVDDSTEGFHQRVNGRFIESTLLWDLLPFGILSPACHYKARNYREPHHHLTNTKFVVPALEDSTFSALVTVKSGCEGWKTILDSFCLNKYHHTFFFISLEASL